MLLELKRLLEFVLGALSPMTELANWDPVLGNWQRCRCFRYCHPHDCACQWRQLIVAEASVQFRVLCGFCSRQLVLQRAVTHDCACQLAEASVLRILVLVLLELRAPRTDATVCSPS